MRITVYVLYNIPVCMLNIYYYSQNNTLSSAYNRHFRIFSTRRGFTGHKSAAMPISLKCSLKQGSKNLKFVAIFRNRLQTKGTVIP